MAPHLPPPPTPPPIDSICDIIAIKKLPQKPGAFKTMPNVKDPYYTVTFTQH